MQDTPKEGVKVCKQFIEVTNFIFQIKTLYPDIPAAVVYDVLQDLEYRSKWDKYFLEVNDIGHLNPNNTVNYYASKYIFLEKVLEEKDI